jgi:hypothetical protein
MTRHLSANTTLVLLALLSIGSVALVEHETASLIAALAAIAIALTKVNLVIGNFMHLHWQHRPWRQVLTGWLIVVAIIFAAGLILLPWE